QLIAPEGLDFFRPVAQLYEWLPAQAVNPEPRVLALRVLLLDQALETQHAQMPAHRRSAHAERRSQLARRTRTHAQQVDYCATRGLRQGGEGGVKTGRHRRCPRSVIRKSSDGLPDPWRDT